MKKPTVGRIVFGSSDKESKSIDSAIRKLRNPAPGVMLVSHGFVKRCNICDKSQHAKWHEYSSGEVINPIVLVQWLQSFKGTDVEDFRRAVINYVTFITTLDVGRLRDEGTVAGGNQDAQQGDVAPSVAHSAPE